MKQWNLIAEYYNDETTAEQDYRKNSNDEIPNNVSSHDKDLPISTLVNVRRI